jgi:hypothetical protein
MSRLGLAQLTLQARAHTHTHTHTHIYIYINNILIWTMLVEIGVVIRLVLDCTGSGIHFLAGQGFETGLAVHPARY